ncbi:hypothetical protein DVH24_020336 [Malus domestica]|uniref:Uncharacterized protein n=1 Tax=Malus domestica TaxID=3750 RepID=A0A498JBY7_MALDO|nr:hypothetical protein DVH24_020336 [Malus domestica]
MQLQRSLYYQSQKLAIAYGLISTPPSAAIWVIKKPESRSYVVDGMMERDVVLWNTMLKAYVETGLEEGLYFFSAFHWSGLRLDDVSVRSVLRGIDKVDSYRCKRHTEQECLDIYSWNKTLSEYVKAGENWAADCCTVFERLFCLFIEKSVQSRERSGLNFGELNDIMMCAKWFRKEANKLKFNLASWNAMMFGYVMWDDGQMAKFKIFRGNEKALDSDTVITTSSNTIKNNDDSLPILFVRI